MSDTAQVEGPAFTLEPAARYIGDIPPRTLRYFAATGKIPHIRIGRRLAFLKSDLDAFLSAGRVGAREA